MFTSLQEKTFPHRPLLGALSDDQILESFRANPEELDDCLRALLAAESWAEGFLNRAISLKTYRAVYTCIATPQALPRPPFDAITAVRIHDAEGNINDLEQGVDYGVTSAAPAKIYGLNALSKNDPSREVVVDYTAGVTTPGEIAPSIIQACLVYAKGLLDHDPEQGDFERQSHMAAKRLLLPNRLNNIAE